MESSERGVLPTELCRRIYDDFVTPRISLRHILEFELYRVVLHSILPRNRLEHLSSHRKIRQWLNDSTTFERFKSIVREVIEKRECNIKIDAINEKHWKEFVVDNDEVFETVKHWRTGGEISFTYRWSFLSLPENQLEQMWQLLMDT